MEPWNQSPTFPVGRRVADESLKLLKEAVGTGEDPAAMLPASLVGVNFRRELVDAYVRRTFGDTVRSGPFKGMAYPEIFGFGSLQSPKLLGCYEAELHPVFNTLSAYNRFVDVGCDEGYYLVGAALGCPGLELLGFDVSEASRDACRRLAEFNGVADRIAIEGLCTPDRLRSLSAPRTLILIDIEGSEVELLEQTGTGSLAAADVIVETHRVGPTSTADAVIDLLDRTHDITVVTQQVRDPAEFPDLLVLSQLHRFLAQWEGRTAEPWIVARARQTP